VKGLDTNVLVRLLTQDDRIQGPAAEAYVRRACTRDSPCFINRVVLVELVWVLESAYGYSRAAVGDAVERILRTGEFKVEDTDVARAALVAYRRAGADFADAMIGRGNRAQGCAATATFDRQAAAMEDFELATGGGRGA
jgi:predicted nucleic-acid-binding protein